MKYYYLWPLQFINKIITMMKYFSLPFLLIFLIVAISVSCEDQYNKRVVFYIQSILSDKEIVAQGEFINVSAILSIQGVINENNVEYLWDCVTGEFNDVTKQATIWTAPTDTSGTFTIKLNVKFMGNTEEGEIYIKVVKSPADGWGSLSGYIQDSDGNKLNDVIVSTITNENDTTDLDGFFYISDIPQGNTDLEFSNIGYQWASDIENRIEISGGTHTHLGQISIYYSSSPQILRYEKFPEHQSKLYINHDYAYLYQYFELYKSENDNGNSITFVKTIQPEENEPLIKEEEDSVYFAFRSIPVHGEPSDLSSWNLVKFVDVIDPDSDMSYFSYNSFFNATLYWYPTGYEEYYRGFKVAEVTETSWNFISNLIPPSTFEYTLSTQPGMKGSYYLLAISNSGKYNVIQPESQKIQLEVAEMKYPSGFKGEFQSNNTIKLIWEPISNNNNWYSGYVIEKTHDPDTLEIYWKELTRLNDSYTGSFSDDSVSTGNIYHYRIKSVAYPSGLGDPYYSESFAINVETF